MPERQTSNWSVRQARFRIWYGTRAGRQLYSKIHSRAMRLLAHMHGVHGLQVLGGHPHDRSDSVIDCADITHPILLAGDARDSLRAAPEELPLATGSMAVVVLWHALDLTDAPESLFGEAARVLQDDGALLVVGFHSGSPGWWLHGPGLRRDAGVRGPVRKRMLERWAREAGLRVVAREGFMLPLLPTWGPDRQYHAPLGAGSRYAGSLGGVRLILFRRETVGMTLLPDALRQLWSRRLVRVRGGVQTNTRSLHEQDSHSAY